MPKPDPADDFSAARLPYDSRRSYLTEAFFILAGAPLCVEPFHLAALREHIEARV